MTSGDGTQTFKFDKFPVIHEWVETYPGPDGATKNDSTYDVMYNKYGGVNVTHYEYGSYPIPATVYLGGPWMSLPGFQNPVNDFNIHGVVVGTNGGDAAATSNFGYLQNDFPKIPGLEFDSALMVDDSGQLIVSGKLGDQPMDFLVTQGQPVPAPEPSTLAILGCALAAMRLLSARVGSRS